MKKIFTIFGVIGLILIGLTTYLTIQKLNFIDTAVNTQGIVVDMELSITKDSDGKTSRAYYPIISFVDANGAERTFRSTTGSNPPSYRVNDKIEMLYNPNNPEDASIKSIISLWLLPIILGIFGLIFFLIGFIPFLSNQAKTKNKKRLLQTGRLVSADIDSVGLNTVVSINGRSPYVIYCQWLDPLSNRLHQFKSENIWFNPEPFIKGKQISVYLDEKKPTRYFVDLHFLPKKA